MARLTESIGNDLSKRIHGEVRTGIFDLGRYATDASAYQMMPLAVVVARDDSDVAETLSYANRHGICVLPRGGGTSQCGQTVNHAIVVDFTKYLNRLVELDKENYLCRVESGIVLDELNRKLKPHGLWFPVDVSTASRATIGGMAGNNSCGSRSIRYGLMRDNVSSINAMLVDGDCFEFSQTSSNSTMLHPLFNSLLQIGMREQHEIAKRFPKLLRRVGGYNIDALVPNDGHVNFSHLLVGSEGTLAVTRTIDLKLAPLPENQILGICHFPSFHAAMDSAQHIVELGPIAVELIDRTMIELSRKIPLFQKTVSAMINGEPEAILLVEFAQDDYRVSLQKLRELNELMSDLGFSFDNPPSTRGGVVEAADRTFQASVFDVRKSGLNIMMSMRDDRKPVSFVEDCAVELKDLAEYTSRLTEIFHKHGTRGTWYAHASVGCLHVRPVLDLRQSGDIQAMRAIAEECFEMVRQYKGSHSGEHGDGICRSEFHEKMFGRTMVDAFAEVKKSFDPNGLMNPGKIVDPLKMDDANLFRFAPGYAVPQISTALSWKGWTGAGDGFQGAVEMCNNNGACRKLSGGVMCPSYRATMDECHVTRGRANTLRLALSGQLGKDAMVSDAMHESMKFCVSCKACRRECPTGVDMARMKIEVTAARSQAHGVTFNQRLIAHLPEYAHYLRRVRGFANLPSKIDFLRAVLEPITGFSRYRPLPTWSANPYLDQLPEGDPDGKAVVLFADTFNTWFEPENLRAAKQVLIAAGYRVFPITAARGRKTLCCGRTFLTNGMTQKAKQEVHRLLEALGPYLEQNIPVVGIEPSCVLGFRDEIPSLMQNASADQLARSSFLFEEFLAKENASVDFKPMNSSVLVHGHCHQKSFDQMTDVSKVLGMIPELSFSTIDSGCCGMAGSFGYNRDTVPVSIKMAEIDLYPAINAANHDAIIIADGTSCRHQIELGTGRQAMHVAKLMQSALQSQW